MIKSPLITIRNFVFSVVMSLFLICNSTYLFASELVEVQIAIENHKFYPQQIEVPAATKIKLIVCNNDKTLEEFESTDLKREKIIPANSCVNIILGPLKPGNYSFYGEFYHETAFGMIVVK